MTNMAKLSNLRQKPLTCWPAGAGSTTGWNATARPAASSSITGCGGRAGRWSRALAAPRSGSWTRLGSYNASGVTHQRQHQLRVATGGVSLSHPLIFDLRASFSGSRDLTRTLDQPRTERSRTNPLCRSRRRRL